MDEVMKALTFDLLLPMLLGMWELSLLITVFLIIFLLPTAIGIILVIFRRMRIADTEREILSYLKSRGESTIEKIVRDNDLERKNVIYCLDDMVSRRIVKRVERDGTTLYIV